MLTCHVPCYSAPKKHVVVTSLAAIVSSLATICDVLRMDQRETRKSSVGVGLRDCSRGTNSEVTLNTRPTRRIEVTRFVLDVDIRSAASMLGKAKVQPWTVGNQLV